MSTESSRVGGELYFHIRLFLVSHPLGWAFPPETGFRCFAADRTDPDRVRKPDAAFVSFTALPLAEYERDGFCGAVPDIVAEVVSPRDIARDVEAKRIEWLAAGVQEVWVVFPNSRTVHVYRSDGSSPLFQPSDTLTTPLLPGFAVPVAELFRLPGAAQAPAGGSPA